MSDGILVGYSKGLMFEFLDGTELGTVDTVALRKDDGIELGKILGMKLGFNLVWCLAPWLVNQIA